MSKRTIQVFDDGQKIYEGPENRHAAHQLVERGPQLFGISLKDWALIVGPIFTLGIVSVYLNTTMKATNYLLQFAKNSDNYHSATSGQEFEQGRPVAGYGGAYSRVIPANNSQAVGGAK